MFRANFQRTGVYKTIGVRQLGGLKWKFQQPPEIASRMPGFHWRLTVGDGIVCAKSPGDGENLYGLDSQTGQQIWRYQIGKGKKFFPLGIDNGVVYLGYRRLDSVTRDEYLIAVNVQTGQEKWQFKLPFQATTFSFESLVFLSSPAVADGVVYIGGSDGNLYAVDASSGEFLWHFKTTKNMALTSPAIDEGILCVYSSDGYLYALDLTIRQQLWKFEIGALSSLLFPSFTPAIAKGKVYITSGDNILYCLDIHSGDSLWTFKAANHLLYQPAVAEHILCVGSSEGLFYALDLDTAQPLWTFKTGDFRYWSSPVIADGIVYLGSEGFLQALNLETGEQLWQFQPPLPDQWVLDPPMFFYGLFNQFLKVFTGNTFNLEKFSSPVIADGILYVGCSNGYLYALHK